MPNFTVRTDLLPTHQELAIEHWPVEDQIKFAGAVKGIRGAKWFMIGCAQLSEADRQRVALSFAYAALAGCL